MKDWSTHLFLTNFQLDRGINTKYISIVNADDIRIKRICQMHPSFGRMIQKFEDQHQRKIRVSILIARGDAPETMRSGEAIRGFRDAVAQCLVPYARARFALTQQPDPLIWSNPFEFYPWWMSSDFKYLTSNTAAIGAIDDPQRFKGQAQPGLPVARVERYAIDLQLFESIVKIWNRTFSVSNEQREKPDIALFRSLNMAFHASSVPGLPLYGLYDIGRIFALWVSAFEILSHGKSSAGGRKAVLSLIKKVNWQKADLSRPFLSLKHNSQNVTFTFPQFLTHEFYQIRNDFLHGNQVSEEKLYLHHNRKTFFVLPSLVFRMMLMRFLNLERGSDINNRVHLLPNATPVSRQRAVLASYVQSEIEAAISGRTITPVT